MGESSTGEPGASWWGLAFPQWQGAGPEARPVRTGGLALARRYADVIPMHHVAVSDDTPAPADQGVYALDTLALQIRGARKLLDAAHPARVLTIGGDCGVEIAPVPYLNERYGCRLGVLWFDAHADANDAASSPSGHFHGMPVRTLLGAGPPLFRPLVGTPLRPDQVVLVGARALDPGERRFLANRDIGCWATEEIDPDGVASAVAARGWSALYLHVDLDVLDPDEFPDLWFPTPGGVPAAQLIATIHRLRDEFDVVGGSVVEYVPRVAQNLGVIDELVFDGFGLREQSWTRDRRDTPW